uniref:CDKN2A interacting protein N-terminal like n=1 Tax=Gasterosteus aculeatus aculeatus TaxID=481459 RepID=G3QCK3_GASAC
MANMDVEDFIQQNRALAEQVETFRGYWESEKHWEARREFILRNISDYEDPHLDQLVSLSMVWANNVFLGCRYSSVLLEKVKDMAEGVVVEDAPVFKTRDEIMKKQKNERVEYGGDDGGGGGAQTSTQLCSTMAVTLFSYSRLFSW